MYFLFPLIKKQNIYRLQANGEFLFSVLTKGLFKTENKQNFLVLCFVVILSQWNMIETCFATVTTIPGEIARSEQVLVYCKCFNQTL